MALQALAPAGMSLLKLLGRTAAVSGAGLGLYGLSEIPSAVEEGILKAGPNDPDDPTKFKTNPLQNLLIDKDKLSDKYFKRQQNDLYRNDSDVRERVKLLGQKKADIGFREADAYLADTQEEAERLTTNKNLTKELQGMVGGGALYAGLGDKPTNAMLRRAITQADSMDRYGGGRGTLIAQEESRLEDLLRSERNRAADRRDERDLNRMQFDLQNRKLDMEEARNYRLDRQKAIMQIMQGFKQMGNAFAY